MTQPVAGATPGDDFRLVADSIPAMVWRATPDGSIEYLNRQGIEYTGLPADAGNGRDWPSLLHPDDAEGVRRTWEHAVRAETPYESECRIRRADGDFRWHLVRAHPVHAGNAGVVGWVGIAENIDAHKRSGEQLQSSERLLAEALAQLEMLQSAAPIGFGFADRELRMVRLNQRLAAVNGAPLEEQLGLPIGEIVPKIWPQLEPVLRRVLELGEPTINLEVRGETAEEPGRVHHWLANYYPVRVETEIIGVGVVVVDITERVADEEFRSAVIDNMVEGLYALDGEGCLTFMNRAASMMLGWTEDELRGKPMHPAVHFQKADGTPVPAGECSLLKVRGQTHPSRVTDDAFTRKDGSILPVAYSAAPLRVATAAQGVVVVFRDISDEKDEAARALRELSALSWVGRIRDALNEDRFVLYAQPIFPLNGGHRRDELLLRMIGSSGEVISPGSFLPVAEKYSLIAEIDRWVVTQAVRLAATGRRVQANLSAVSFTNPDLLSVLIERELEETGADPARIVFEITETAIASDFDAAETFAHTVSELGCELAIDDFGTGFGSLTYVRRLPIRYLKIDVQFVRDLVTTPSNLHVIRAIVSLARAFEIKTIAEGIEEERALDLLKAEGVDYGQGFLLGRPAPIDAS